MPSRPIVALIITAWAATIGWYVHRELWPVLFPGEAPPFVIELADEVTSEIGGEQRRPDVLWGIYRGQRRIGRAETRLRYFRADNTFEMETRIVELKLPGLIEVHVPEMINAYRVTRQGDLRSLRMEGRMAIAGMSGTAAFHGEVRGQQLIRSGTLEIPVIGKITPVLEPVPVPAGSVLNPMHPVPKIKDLKPGRRWTMPLINPMGDAVEPALQAIWEHVQPGKKLPVKFPEGPKSVQAEVLTETTEVELDGKMHLCQIIEYRSEGSSDPPARTLVRISDGAVLRQEAYTLGDKIVLKRE